MRFLLDAEQRDFARTLDALLSAADTPSAARAWSRGEHAPGRALWDRLAQAGVFALAVPESLDGAGPLPLELTLAFEALGHHAVPGPAVETVAAAILLTALAETGDPTPAKTWLPRLAAGTAVATLAATAPQVGRQAGTLRADGPTPAGPHDAARHAPAAPEAQVAPAAGPTSVPSRTAAPQRGLALDADVADLVLVVAGEELWLAAEPGPAVASHDPVRRLFAPVAGGELLARGPQVAAAAERARHWAALATAAQALGVGRALLDQTVAYVRERRQFGVAVGSFQAVKHRLADVLIGLEFARPLLHAAALSLDPVDLAMAKLACGEAGYAAARAALQLHGAIGYTEEPDLSLWLRKARPLRDAWGTPAACRARIVRG